MFKIAYMSALTPAIIQFFLRLQKEEQIETTNENSTETHKKTLSKL